MAVAKDSAENAYAAASAEAKPVAKPQVEPKAPPAKPDAPVVAEQPAAAAPETKVAAPQAAPKPPVAAKKAAPVKAASKKAAAKKVRTPAPAKVAKSKPRVAAKTVAKPVGKPAAVSPEPKQTITELKEKIMAKKTEDFTQPMTVAMTEMQDRAKVAYEKSTAYAGEMTEFAKGNVEAVVESGKILAGGMQDMGSTVVAETKSAYETMTADLKEMAAVKSPTELFQLQGAILRRNFDAMVQASSKNAETAMKLANDAFAPISARANLAAEKMAKVAA